MSLWNEVPTSLTSFAPLNSEAQSSGTFLSRFFKRGKDDSDQSSTEGSRSSSRDVSVERGASREHSVERLSRREQLLDTPTRREQLVDTPAPSISVAETRLKGANATEPLIRGAVAHKSRVTEATTRRMSVVARLTDIVNRRTATPQVYRDSDFKQYWMPDSSCKECYNCNDKFTTFRRRHHCRICGQIFCNTCCNKELSGKIIGYKGSIRVCDYCYQIVNSYAQKATGDPRVTTEVLHEIQSETSLTPDLGGKGQQRSNYDLHWSLSLKSPSDVELNNDGIAPFDRTPQSEYISSLSFPRERRLLLQDSQELRSLYTQMLEEEQGVEFDNYRVRLRNSHRVIAGNKLVDWLLKYDKVATRVQGVAVGQALIDAEYLEPLHNMTTPFRDDFTLYRPTQSVTLETVSPDITPVTVSVSEDSAPLWFQQIQPNTHPDDVLDIHGPISADEAGLDEHLQSIASQLSHDSTGEIKVDERHFDDPPPVSNVLGDITESMFEGVVTTSEPAGWRNLVMNTEDAEQKEAFTKLQQEHHDHLTQLTRQLLGEEHLPLGWADIIISTVDRVALFVQPDIKHSSDDMDIRKYVHIKKIPGGLREQTGMIHGVIFKKNVANRKMPQSITRPNVLLLYGSIEYQRVENKMSTLEPLIAQEREFLKKNIAKIVDLKQKPHVLVVEKSVANIAQKFLLDEGITLINNVKMSVMQRLSRFLDTTIVASIDSLVRGVKLGFCHTFSVQSYVLPAGETKTMVSFSGCATHLGCAITLRGGPSRELKRVKKIMRFMLYASYHSRLEIAFCIDECMTPICKEDFDLDKEDLSKNTKEKHKSGTEKEPLGEARYSQEITTTSVKIQEDVIGNEVVSLNIQKHGEDGAKKQEINPEILPTVRDRYCAKLGGSDQIMINSSKSGDMLDLDLRAKHDGTQGNQGTDALEVVSDVGANSEHEASESLLTVESKETDSITAPFDQVEVSRKDNVMLVNEDLGKSYVQTLVAEEGLNASDSSGFLIGNDGSSYDSGRTFSFSPLNCHTQEIQDSEDDTKPQSKQLTVAETSNVVGSENSQPVRFYISDQSNEQDPYTSRQLVGDQTPINLPLVDNKHLSVAVGIGESVEGGQRTEGGGRTEGIGTTEGGERLGSRSMPLLRARQKSGQRSERDRSPHLGRKSEAFHLTDKSDPLQNYQISQDETIFQSSLALQEHLVTHRHQFRKALESVVLCISPFIQYELPYLETENGANCELRRYLQEEIYWSHTFSPKTPKTPRHMKQSGDKDVVKKTDACPSVTIKDAHEFIQSQLALPAYNLSVQYLIAAFRAYGGRLNVVRDMSCPNDKKDKLKSELKKACAVKDVPAPMPPGTTNEWRVDCLDPFRHQRIAVLFSSFSYMSENHPSPCVYPWVVNMEFYGRNDITLGGFLERFCFRPSYVCPSDSCNTSMDQHIRRFIHRTGSISIMLKRHSKPIQHEQERILMWSWCYRCKQVTKIIPMSINTWNMSFAKYLELRFHGNSFKRMDHDKCNHSLHHDHYQYFGFKETVASFRYSPIKLKEIKLPPLVILHCHQMEVMQLYRLKEEVKTLSSRMVKMFSVSLEYMTNLKSAGSCDTFSQTISDYILQQQNEKKYLRDLANSTRDKLDVLLNSADNAKEIMLSQNDRQMYESIEDSLVIMKKCLAETVTNWNLKFQDLYMAQKKASRVSQKKEKDAVSMANPAVLDAWERDGKPGPPAVEMDDVEVTLEEPLAQIEDILSVSEVDYMDARRKSDFSFIDMSPPTLTEVKSVTSLESYLYGVTPAGEIPDSRIGGLDVESSSSFETESERQEMASEQSDEQLEAQKEEQNDGQMTKEIDRPTEENKEKKIDQQIDKCVEGHMNKQMDGNKDRQMGGNRNKQIDNEMGKQMDGGLDDHFVIPQLEFLNSKEDEDVMERTLIDDRDKAFLTDNVVKKYPVEDQSDSQPDTVGGFRKKIINTILQGSAAYQLPQLFDACEHHMFPKCHRLPLVVYDHEPSSIIAFSLSSSDYNNKLQEVQSALAQSVRSSKTDEMFEKSTKEEGTGLSKKPSGSKLSFFKGSMKEVAQKQDTPPDTVRYVARADSGSIDSPEEADYSVFTASISESTDKSKSGKQAPNMHLEIQFSDSTARFYCKVYFAEQFRQLRKLICPEGEDEFIRSLSRCKPWEAKGGKSGSNFCKTDDDRFILKQMSGMEVESFEKFGPQYFQYISEAKQQQRPTALAKIVGVYRIGFRNQQTNNAMKQDLLIVENLFYDRNISQTFDLKGSERNRLVKNTRSKRDEELVLLDENFLRDSVDNPLYIMPHSKRVLMQAINLDSEFLSSNFVMDYSLLVGLDETRKELVIGVIDYIRTFTWDKKLETILKSNFGGQGKMPTVVSPELYRTRFLDAMARYFLAVPDQWSGLGRDVDL